VEEKETKEGAGDDVRTVREQRAAIQQREEEEAAKRYPGACFVRELDDDRWISIELSAGIRNFIHVAGELEASIEATIDLNDLGNLAEFIHALVCRYNAMAAEANGHAAACRMTPLEPIETGPPKPPVTDYENDPLESLIVNTSDLAFASIQSRALNALSKAGVHTVGALVRLREDEVLRMQDLGRKSLEHLKRQLANRGLALQPRRHF
jgi:hypothetical protein